MGDGSEIIIQLVIRLVFAGGLAAIASSKGRNAVGWFFLGFFFICIALLIILCLSNLKEEAAKWSANDIEQRRLREQLRQEQLKNESLRQHTVARLDIHDQELGIDSRTSAPGLPMAQSPFPSRPSLLAPGADVPPPGLPATNWYIIENDEQMGPYGFALLCSRARQSSLNPYTLVWVEGMPEWQAANTVPNLFPV